MAIQILRDQALWLDGFDLSGVINSLALDYSAALKESPVLQDKSMRRKPGLRAVSVNHQGYFDQPAEEQLFAKLGVADVPMSFGAQNITEGAVAFAFLTALGEYIPGAEVGELFAFSVSGEGSDGDGLIRGTLMHNATRTATGTGTARQLGAAAAGQKLFAALHVIAAGGTTPTLDVTVESDDAMGFASPVTRITFGQKTAIGSEWATPVAGPITDDWWRIAWTIGGVGPSFTFVVIVGIQ